MKKGFFVHTVNSEFSASLKQAYSNAWALIQITCQQECLDFQQALLRSLESYTSVSSVWSGEVETSLGFLPLQFPFSQDSPRDINVQTIPLPILWCNFIRFGIHLCLHCPAKCFSQASYQRLQCGDVCMYFALQLKGRRMVVQQYHVLSTQELKSSSGKSSEVF